MKTFVEFKTDSFPETQFDEHGDISVPGGKEILEYIASKLNKDTPWDISPIYQRSFYGWEMVIGGKRKYILVIQQVDKWLVLFDEMFSIYKLIIGVNKKELEEIYYILNEILAQNDEFQDIVWFTKKEYEGKS